MTNPSKSDTREELIARLAELTRRSVVDFHGIGAEAALTLVRMIENGEWNPVAQTPLSAATWLQQRGIMVSTLPILKRLGWLEGELPMAPLSGLRPSLHQLVASASPLERDGGRRQEDGRVVMTSRKKRGKQRTPGIER